jgi:hypothetical protein
MQEHSPFNTVELQFEGQILMAILEQYSVHGQRQVYYESNCLMVSFDHDGMSGWEALSQVMGRNMSSTVLVPQGGHILELGNPKFKWMMLPYSKVVLTVKYSTLLTPGGSRENWSNKDTPASLREYNRKLRDPSKCSHCLRRCEAGRPKHGCFCHEFDGDDSGSDSEG